MFRFLINQKISVKIAAMIIVTASISVALAWYSNAGMQDIDRRYSELTDLRMPALMQVARTGRQTMQAGYDAYKVFVYPGASEAAQAAAQDRTAMFDRSRQFLAGAKADVPALEDEIGELEAILERFDASSRAAVAAGLADQAEAALPLLVAMDGHAIEYRESLAKLLDSEVAEFASLSDGMSVSIAEIGITTVVISIIAAALGVLMALLVTRGTITMPLARLGRTMEDLSNGKLDAEVQGTERKDEVGGMSRAVQVFKDNALQARAMEQEALALRKSQEADRERKAAADRQTQAELQEFVDSIEGGFARLSQGDMTVRIGRAVAAQYEPIRGQFNDTVEKLESTLGSVVTSIGSIRTGLGEINVASNDLAQRTEQQAASLEETVAALAEVTRAVNETAQDAGRAQESAESANRNAAKGGEIVGKAVEAMRGIEQSSEKIGKIIGVIDEIAFQTNLLALNAGVEAARAGEAGRGFAVVAQEVRGLAQRSAEAAKEIKDLISTSSEQVEAGVELVSASGRSLDQIITEVGDMSRTVAEIARRAREQAVSLKEVQTAADQMDKVTQQNAAMVEEATAAAQSLAAETDELGRLIAEFKLASAQSRAASAPAQRQPAAANRAAPSQRPVVQMRPTSQGNAALKTLEDNWEEF